MSLYGGEISKNSTDFIKKISSKGSAAIHFHNLKFDSEFLIHHLMSQGYVHSTEAENLS